MAALLAGGARAHRRDLDRAAQAVCCVVFLNVCARMSAPQKSGRHRYGRRKHATWRALFGARLRHALDGRDFSTRLRAILEFVRDLDRHVAALKRRLRRGLTRLRVLYPERVTELCASWLGPRVVSADTS